MIIVNFEIGEVVNVIQDNKVVKGVIRDIFSELNPPILLIDTNEGDLKKVNINHVAKVEDKKVLTDKIEDQKKDVEKSEITITPKQFRDIAIKVIAEETRKMGDSGPILGLATTLIVAKIHRALFFDDNEGEE